MKIAVMGTGALGALFAGYLARAGEEIFVVDIKPEIVGAIRAGGVRIREASGAGKYHPAPKRPAG